MELIFDSSTGMFHRPDTLDSYVIKEVGRCYDPLITRPEDVVLDLGGNIGAYARLISPHVAKVITIEPDPTNFDILMRNIQHSENIEALQLAVVGDDREEVTLFLNTNKNMGSHSLIVSGGDREGITVPARNFEDILWEYSPTVIKMDIEGSEYDLLNSCNLDGVRALAVEFHLTRRDYKDAIPGTRAKLAEQGFRETVPFVYGPGHWHKIAFYERA